MNPLGLIITGIGILLILIYIIGKCSLIGFGAFLFIIGIVILLAEQR